MNRIPYHQGDYHGEIVSYYPNGNLLLSATYQFDLKHGVEKEYHENGKLKRSTNYFFNIKNGWERHYDRNGNVTFELFYWNDELY
jgi:antitoxin component YwqK of YwqJK toxin-antitoxin module